MVRFALLPSKLRKSADKRTKIVFFAKIQYGESKNKAFKAEFESAEKVEKIHAKKVFNKNFTDVQYAFVFTFTYVRQITLY